MRGTDHKKYKLNCKVNASTFWNLCKLARKDGKGESLGSVVDRLVKEKMERTYKL